MEHFPWDAPFAGIEPPFDSHVGHYVIAAAALISCLLWIFSARNTGLHKLAAVAVGGSIALAAIVLMIHLFPPGPIPPGAMP